MAIAKKISTFLLIGVATVGDYFGGGNAGKDVKTVDPYSWRYTSTFME